VAWRDHVHRHHPVEGCKIQGTSRGCEQRHKSECVETPAIAKHGVTAMMMDGQWIHLVAKQCTSIKLTSGSMDKSVEKIAMMTSKPIRKRS
jgi:hypothetical protein